MKDFDLRNLDFNNAGAWPVPVKAFFCALAFVIIGAAGWYFLHADQKTQLEGLQAQELTLRTEFEFKQSKAANLEPLKQQLEEMEVMLFQMLRQLPSKTEMPDLIVDISQTALSTGISNELFQPGAEIRKDFYAEKPIQLRMIGTYHQFGAFVSGVASLPRVVIMTMSDISLRPRNAPGASANELLLEGTIKTYRYLDENETGGAQ